MLHNKSPFVAVRAFALCASFVVSSLSGCGSGAGQPVTGTPSIQAVVVSVAPARQEASSYGGAITKTDLVTPGGSVTVTADVRGGDGKPAAFLPQVDVMSINGQSILPNPLEMSHVPGNPLKWTATWNVPQNVTGTFTLRVSAMDLGGEAAFVVPLLAQPL